MQTFRDPLMIEEHIYETNIMDDDHPSESNNAYNNARIGNENPVEGDDGYLAREPDNLRGYAHDHDRHHHHHHHYCHDNQTQMENHFLAAAKIKNQESSYESEKTHELGKRCPHISSHGISSFPVYINVCRACNVVISITVIH